MFDNLQGVLKQIYNLAKDKKQYSINIVRGCNAGGFTKNHNPKKEELRRVLENMEIESIKIIKVIMSLGKNKKYNAEDSIIQIYDKTKNKFDALGWKSKCNEIENIINEFYMDEYLKSGFDILKIKL